MNTLIDAWGRSQNQRSREEIWRDRFWQIGLWLAAIGLFSLDLDRLPLRIGDESRLAQLVQNLYLTTNHSWEGLWAISPAMPSAFPGPLVPALIALAYHWQGFSVEMTRLPGAMLGALSVPLIYGIGREIFRSRVPALFSALLFLTFVPVVYEGRLASLSGTILCFSCLLVVCGLRSRRNLRWSLALGLSWATLMLTQGAIGLLMALVMGLFLAWDTPRLLKSSYFWLGIVLGSLPALLGYGLQFSAKPGLGMGLLLSALSFAPPGLTVLKLLPFMPGLVFSVTGLFWAWQSQNWGWAKLILLWAGVAIAAFVWGGNQAGMMLAPYPALALAGGMALGEIQNLPSDRPYPASWQRGLLVWVVATGILGLSLPWTHPAAIANWRQYTLLLLILAAYFLTLITTYFLIKRRDPQFVAILLWGSYVSLFLFVISPHWTGIL